MRESRETSFGPYLDRIVWSIGRRIITPGGEISYNIEDTQSIPVLDKYLNDIPKGSALGLKALLIIFDLCPFIFTLKPHRFVNLSTEDQDLYILDWQESRIYYRRMVLLLLKTLYGMGYYGDKNVLDEIGFYEACPEKNSD
jgi:hypothetical protein